MKLRILALLLLSTVSCVASFEERLAAQKKAAPIFERAIAEAKEVTLLAIDPHPQYEKKQDKKSIEIPGQEESWIVVKEANLRDPKSLIALASSLRSGIEKCENGAAPCFEPRHGIRVRIDGREVTMLICFRCAHAYVIGYPPCDSFYIDIFHPSGEPTTTWNRIFQEAGLEIIK